MSVECSLKPYFTLTHSTTDVFFNPPEHELLVVSYCDHMMSVVRRAASTVCFKKKKKALNDIFSVTAVRTILLLLLLELLSFCIILLQNRSI